jgi:dCMP deaminase
MKEKMIAAHMKAAEVYASLSSAKKMQVGAIVVKNDRIISIGYNGTPAGWDNTCEDMVYETEICFLDYGGPGMPVTVGKYVTRPEVIHAEANAIAKLAKSSDSGEEATLFCTHAPCLDCAKLIYGAGIRNVYYRNTYRSEAGLDFLKKCNIEVEKV